MRTRNGISSLLAAGALAVACNAVLGLEELEHKPGSDDGSGAEAGSSGAGRGGSSGSGGSTGGSSARGGTTTGGSAGTAGESGGGMGGGNGDCEPDHETTCGSVDPTLLGNCRDGQIVCQSDGTWGDCSVTAQDADSCDVEGDDADCDGTPNSGCPCLAGTARDCGPDTDDGICEFGTQTCENETWGPCEGAVLPEPRDCLSAVDNDCDGTVDNARDDECPCAVDGAHVCVEDAPADWEGPMAIATAAATAASPLCTGTGYERQVLTMFGSIDNGTANCGCTCSAPASMMCGAVNVQTGPNCAQLQTVSSPPEYTLNPGTCINVNGSGTNYFPGANFSAGNCTPQPSSTLVDAKFTRRVTGCEPTAGSTSAAGCAAAAECVPELDNPLEKFCISHAGNVNCPSGPYTEKNVYYDTVDDPRTCSACTCGSSSGSCTGSLNIVRQPCPGTILSASVSYGSCEMVYDGGLALAATASTPMPQGMCPPSAVSAQGAITTTGDTTVCCKP